MLFTPLKTLFDAAVLAAAFIFNAAVLGVEWESIAIALGGSVSGAVILAYFRPEVHLIERVFKVIASAIGGLVLGTVLQEYLVIQSDSYRLGLFFLCSMLALVVLRSLLNFTERNAVEIIRGSLQRFLNLKTPEERGQRRKAGRELDEKGR